MKKVALKFAQFKNSYYLCIAIEGNLTANSGDSLAQLVEHNTFNVGVLGSSPRRITKTEAMLRFFYITQALHSSIDSLKTCLLHRATLYEGSLLITDYVRDFVPHSIITSSSFLVSFAAPIVFKWSGS